MSKVYSFLGQDECEGIMNGSFEFRFGRHTITSLPELTRFFARPIIILILAVLAIQLL